MNTEITYIQFKCDQCGKDTIPIRRRHDLSPKELEGWVIGLNMTYNSHIHTVSKDFCCSQCVKEYIDENP